MYIVRYYELNSLTKYSTKHIRIFDDDEDGNTLYVSILDSHLYYNSLLLSFLFGTFRAFRSLQLYDTQQHIHILFLFFFHQFY